MARTVGLKIKKSKAARNNQNQTPSQTTPAQTTDNGNSNPEGKKE